MSRAISRAAGTARIKTAKIGLIGHQAPGFVDLHPDPFALHKTFQGCVFEHVGLADLVQAADGIDQESVDADRKLAVPGAFADRVDDERSSRLYLALKRLVEAENLDAIAIRCWPELPRDYGQWPYLAVTRLADEGLPVACEGDVDGALTMLCCKFLGCARAKKTVGDGVEAGTVLTPSTRSALIRRLRRRALHLGLARARPFVVRMLARRHVSNMPHKRRRGRRRPPYSASFQ